MTFSNPKNPETSDSAEISSAEKEKQNLSREVSNYSQEKSEVSAERGDFEKTISVEDRCAAAVALLPAYKTQIESALKNSQKIPAEIRSEMNPSEVSTNFIALLQKKIESTSALLPASLNLKNFIFESIENALDSAGKTKLSENKSYVENVIRDVLSENPGISEKYEMIRKVAPSARDISAENPENSGDGGAAATENSTPAELMTAHPELQKILDFFPDLDFSDLTEADLPAKIQEQIWNALQPFISQISAKRVDRAAKVKKENGNLLDGLMSSFDKNARSFPALFEALGISAADLQNETSLREIVDKKIADLVSGVPVENLKTMTRELDETQDLDLLIALHGSVPEWAFGTELVPEYDAYLKKGGRAKFPNWIENVRPEKKEENGFTGWKLKKMLGGIPMIGQMILKLLASFGLVTLATENSTLKNYEEKRDGTADDVSENEEVENEVSENPAEKSAEEIPEFKLAIDRGKISADALVPVDLQPGGKNYETFSKFLSTLNSDHFSTPIGKSEMDLFVQHAGKTFSKFENDGKKFSVPGSWSVWKFRGNKSFEHAGTASDTTDDSFFGWLQKEKISS
ncbi:hypothetical protein HN954_00790 [bacterium]|jgi:hypothetical protein|nr:hypothetical protein [bacterium]MBT6831571.1 hypothetical protein [bacterium]MBT6995950.1 hypothetical protein [bacterium]MBT7772393.1 hypothetical protein [bacterium]